MWSVFLVSLLPYGVWQTRPTYHASIMMRSPSDNQETDNRHQGLGASRAPGIANRAEQTDSALNYAAAQHKVEVDVSEISVSNDEWSTPLVTQHRGKVDDVSPLETASRISTYRWTPLQLPRVSFMSFVFATTTLMIVIIILIVIDRKRNGIVSAQSSYHYLWTFGPTAVLVFFSAFWTQVEYWIKELTPWMLLPNPAYQVRAYCWLIMCRRHKLLHL